MGTPTKVCKFGGTSVANAEQIQKVAEIVKGDKARKYIVVSAPAGVTDTLERIWDKGLRWGLYPEGEILSIYVKFAKIADQLGFDEAGKAEVHNAILRRGLHREYANFKTTRDDVVSLGEFVNAKIVSRFLGAEFVDAEDIIFFEENGELDAETTRKAAKNRLKRENLVVIPGFYGLGQGKIQTFDRGGSDITGAIVAEAVEADVYENWTDVEGICTADPRIVAEAQPIEEISYSEMREMAYSGAKVFAHDAVLPALNANIPINIRSTNNPEHPGTMVKGHRTSGHRVAGIAGRKGFSLITIRYPGINQKLGFIRRSSEVLENHGVSVEHMPGSIDSVTVVVEREQIDGIVVSIVRDISMACKIPENCISIYDGFALISVVGDTVPRTPGVAGNALTALGDCNVSTEVVNQGADGSSMIVGIWESDYEKAMRALYKKLFE